MPTDRWQRLEQLFTQAGEQPASTRAEFLARTCGPDDSMRDDVASLLRAMEHSGDFLGAPALEVFARQISSDGWSVQPGDRIGAYTVERRLGVGGMGEVWRARDERLGRDVAIKLLLPHASNAAERMQALQREARAVATLNHTNVLTVYDVGDHAGAPYLVTECLEGESLRTRLGRGALMQADALDVALQVARGLAAAHERGIVHRDLKPENVFLAHDGRVKILDFGLASVPDTTLQAMGSPDFLAESARSLAAGTAGYMAPEQMRGQAVDGRADIFALGALLYEMLAGRQPFKGDSTFATLSAVLTAVPADLSALNLGIPKALSRVVGRCLAKSPGERFASAADVVSALDSVVRRKGTSALRLRALLRRPAAIVTMLCLLLASAAVGWRWSLTASRVRWARSIAAPEIQRLLQRGDLPDAFLLARQALDRARDEPHIRQLWLDVSLPQSMTTDPPGAEVALAPYRTPVASWLALGQTPLKGVRVPRGLFRVRISMPGFQSIEGTGEPGALPRYQLDPVGAVPPGMVRVVRGRDPERFGPIGDLDDYWIDRFETTNRQFKEFVDQGGYRRREYWQEPFMDGARRVPWEEAVERFRDATGQPGPATWKFGTYADGQAEFPVGGVSWYEAAAYATFAGKSLPTVFHWYRAAAMGRFADILKASNFSGKGPARVGSYAGLGPFGTYDMAGNVKEWCWNETNGRQRFILGGDWNDHMYMFADYDSRGPFERAPGYGFRVVKYIQPLPAAVAAPVPIEGLGHDVRKHRPVGDDIFAVYRRQYAYDHTPLNAVVEATEEGELWLKHTVAFDAAYGGERMRAYLFLPKGGVPPYQTVVFFPGANAFVLRSNRDLSPISCEFIIRSGRALLYPVYKGSYERQTADDLGPVGLHDIEIAWSRDLGRAIDYLETRADIDRARLSYYGVSTGALAGISLTALEPRLKASVLQGIGLAEDVVAPESDPLNYAPRVRLPTLILNGRYDFESPLDTVQRPLLDLLGTPAEHKRLAVVETGHAVPIDVAAREILPWLDRYLGPVVQAPAPTPSPAVLAH